MKDVMTKEEYQRLPKYLRGAYTLHFTTLYPSGRRYGWTSKNPVTKDIFVAPLISIGIEVKEGWKEII